MHSLASLPQWVLCLIFPVGALLALGGLTLVLRKVAPAIGLTGYDGDILDTATQNSLGGAYVILGFSLVMVLGSVDKLGRDIMTEATRIESLDRLLVLEGSAEAQHMRKTLRAYTESVLQTEWPVLHQQKGAPTTGDLLQNLFREVGTIKVDSNRQTVLFTEIIRKTEEVVQSRQQRIAESSGSLPTLFWILCYCGFAGVIVIAALRLLDSTPVRAVALATQIAVLALLFSAVLIIDHPFLGDEVVDPGPIMKALSQIEKRDP